MDNEHLPQRAHCSTMPTGIVPQSCQCAMPVVGKRYLLLVLPALIDPVQTPSLSPSPAKLQLFSSLGCSLIPLHLYNRFDTLQLFCIEDGWFFQKKIEKNNWEISNFLEDEKSCSCVEVDGYGKSHGLIRSPGER